MLKNKIMKKNCQCSVPNCLSIAIPHFIAVCLIVLHICCIFYKLIARPSVRKKILTHLIAVFWHQTHNIPAVVFFILSGNKKSFLPKNTLIIALILLNFVSFRYHLFLIYPLLPPPTPFLSGNYHAVVYAMRCFFS